MDWLLIWVVIAAGDVEVAQIGFDTEGLCRTALVQLEKNPPAGADGHATGYCVQVLSEAEQRDIILPQRSR